MAFDLATLKTDREKEEKGAWIDYVGGSKLLIARWHNRKFDQGLVEVAREYRRENASMMIDDLLASKKVFKLVANTILLGWEGIAYEGKEVEYTPAIGEPVLEAVPDFFKFVVESAMERENYRVAGVETQLGNSLASSSGS